MNGREVRIYGVYSLSIEKMDHINLVIKNIAGRFNCIVIFSSITEHRLKE